MKTILKLGSILLDGTPVKPGIRYQPGQTISFNDGNDLQWVVVNGLLIADRALLVNISWDDLDRHGFVFGKRVVINGYDFLCRLLWVGTQDGESNEWDSALDATSEANSLWHWKMAASWGREKVSMSLRVNRGYSSPRYSYWDPSSYRTAVIGFRPTLELLPSSRLSSGNRVCALGGQSILYGKLLDTTVYDITIQPDQASMIADIDDGKFYTKLDNGSIAIDHTQMTVQAIKEN